MAVVQELADKVREETRPPGEVNLACRFKCINNLVFNPFKLDWEDCPLCKRNLVEKVGLEGETEEDILKRHNIPVMYKNSTLIVQDLFPEGDYVREQYTSESINNLEEVLSELTESVFDGKGFQGNYFLNTQSVVLDHFVFPYMLKAIRMGLKVSPYILATDLGLLLLTSKREMFQLVLQRDMYTDAVESIIKQETYFAKIEAEGSALVELYKTNATDIKASDILFIEIPLNVSSTDLTNIQTVVRFRTLIGKGTVIVSSYGRFNSSIKKALQALLINPLMRANMVFKEVNLKGKSRVSGDLMESTNGSAIEALNKFQINTSLL